MHNAITSEIVVAYSLCPRKAFLLLCTDEQGMLHEYIRLLEQQKSLNQTNYLRMLNVLNQISLEENYIVSLTSLIKVISSSKQRLRLRALKHIAMC